MAIIKRLFLAVIFFLILNTIHGEELNYYIDLSGKNPQFVQRIVWEMALYVSRYEVIVEERLEDGTYSEAGRESVTENFAEFSLSAGSYRYRIDVYDLLDEFSYSTEWLAFNVLPALQPVIKKISPRVFIMGKNDALELKLNGQNLLPESEYSLVQNDIFIIPESIISDEDSAVLLFPEDSLAPGKYSVFIRNPGGLTVQSGAFTIKNNKFTEWNLSLGYAPIFPLYGYLFKDSGLEAPFSGIIYPIGGVLRVGFIPFSFSFGNLGLEFSASLNYLKEEMDYYTTKAFLINSSLAILYQKYFLNETFSINANLGAGISALTNFHYEYLVGPSTENKNSVYPSVLVGFSFSYFFYKPFYLNAGMDFIHIFSPKGDGKMPGLIRPFVSVGMKI